MQPMQKALKLQSVAAATHACTGQCKSYQSFRHSVSEQTSDKLLKVQRKRDEQQQAAITCFDVVCDWSGNPLMYPNHSFCSCGKQQYIVGLIIPVTSHILFVLLVNLRKQGGGGQG